MSLSLKFKYNVFVRIYTKTGDRGKTSLLGGKRVSKNHPIIDAVGDLDELNSCLGVVRSLGLTKKTDQLLEKIQRDLFCIQCVIASPKKNPRLPEISDKDTQTLEHEIDDMNTALPGLRNFILPGGSSTASFLHLARTICRRAERKIISPYLNRLSDLLFVLARFENKRRKKTETIWKGIS